MYEMLLKWGMDSLSKFTGIKGEHELSIIREAIATKNSIILERYKECWKQYDALADLCIAVDEELDDFLKNSSETDGTAKSARVFIQGDLAKNFHPKYYRKVMKIRSKFDGGNDLISSYSMVFIDLINIETLVSLSKKKKCYSRSHICRLYRGLWTKYAEIIAIILRASSSDLRFWATDIPYVRHTDKWALVDYERILAGFESNSWSSRNRNYLSLESKKGVDRFWYDLDEYHANSKTEQKHAADA